MDFSKSIYLNFKRVILLLIVANLTILSLQSQSREVKLAQRKAEKTEKFQKKYYQWARRKVIKRRRKMQHETTQKRMKEADRRARRFNRNRNDIFFIKYFKKRKIRK